MSQELRCPNCQYWNDEPDDCNEQDFIYFCNCKQCDKVFGFNISYSKTYDEFETPCQNENENGEIIEHKWNKAQGSPIEYFKNRYRCEYCEKEKILTQEEILKLKL